jgi:uncharacterized protein (TIGR00251 family)
MLNPAGEQSSISMIRETATGVEIDVRVMPRARKTGLGGVRDGALLVRLAAPPIDHAANDTLIVFLGDLLHVPIRAIQITSGERSRRKRVSIAGISGDEVRRRVQG